MTLSPVGTRLASRLLQTLPVVFLVVVVLVFGCLSNRFLSMANFINILLQSAHLAILAIGMSFVLLVAGVDLSVGAVMYVVSVLLSLYLTVLPPWLCLPVVLAVGASFGAVNGFLIVVLRVAPFIATLATLFVGRGIGLFLSDTKTVLARPPVMALARQSVFGIRMPLLLAFGGIALAFFLLRLAPFGRYVFAIGADREGARRAGIKVERKIFALYCLSGAFAALAGFVLLSQIAAASSTFGERKEFQAIAAAVLGGTSLFGGRGGVFGPVLGAVLIQTVGSGLVMTDTNPYVYPLVTAAIIFLAVLLDSLRTRATAQLERRRIRIEELPDPARIAAAS